MGKHIHEVAPNPANSDRPDSSYRSFPVVGLGVSATQVDVLPQFFQQLSAAGGIAYVVALSSDSQAEIESAVASISQATRLTVTLVSRPTPIETNRVFVIPANKQLTVSAGHLIISELHPSPGSDGQLELFFRALADAYGEQVYGVLIADTTTVGAVGLARIKERGGITLAHGTDEMVSSTARYRTLDATCIDLLLPAENIPQKLLGIWANSQLIGLSSLTVSRTAPGKTTTAEEVALCEIVMQVRSVTGQDLKCFKRAAILQKIERRMRVTGQPALCAYAKYLHGVIDEAHALLADLMPVYTRFFRDADAFEFIENKVLPPLFERKQDGRHIRVWSAGCSTGEEAYSLAMLLCEKAAQQESTWRIQVFATDTNEHAISSGRAGLFSSAITSDVTPARLRLFFTHEQGHYKVKDELREKVLFARHDLLSDPPFTKIDLISCRNLLENFEPAVQRQLLRIFHFALRPGGYLMLGVSEMAHAKANADLFSPVDVECGIYRANDTNSSGSLVDRVGNMQNKSLPHLAHPYDRRRASFDELHRKVLEEYVLPSVIVNDALEIVHMSDNAGQFLGYIGGEPTHNLIKIVHPELQPELRAALFQSLRTNEVAESRRVSMNRGGRGVLIDLTVKPFEQEETGLRFALVLFQEVSEATRPKSVQQSDSTELSTIAQLEEELQRTRERLLAAMEDSDAYIEGLRAANEELQAINEELRAATAELETSREELQAVNEEVITVNDELQAGMEQTSRANSNLQNLITSTDIATLFVDRNLCINWFTPRAAKLFRIIESDTGRSLLHIAHRLEYDELADDAAQVFESLGRVEREVRSDDGSWYLARHLPYRANDDRIEGAVLTFIDISARREAEQKLREEEQLMQLVAESASDYAIITTDTEGMVTSWNRGAEYVFGYSQAEMRNKSADIVFLPDDREAGAPADERERARRDGRAENERWHVRKDGSRLYCSGTLTPLGESQLRGYVKICRDLTQRKQQEMAQELELERSQTASQRKDQFFAMMSHELKHPLNLVQLNAELLSRLPVIRSSKVMSKASQAIMQAVRNQAQIIDDLLDLSRVRTGKLRLKRTAVDLDQVIAEILNGIHSEIVESRLEVTYDPTSAIGMVLHADPTRVEQVVWNLISNALKFTPSGGHIELVLQRESEMARLDVIDDGPGIDPQHVSHMFDLFDQADNHQALRHKDGLGIGLALVRELTEAHGGRVEAHSEGLGRGARFSVWLPLHAQPAESQQLIEDVEGGRLEGLRIMLVDDSPDVVETLQLLLELEGAVVTSANSGQAALELLSVGAYELLISDIGMPGMDGHQLMEAVRSRPEGEKIRGIALTGFASSEDIKRATSAGFDRHIGKPVSLDALIEAVETVVKRIKDKR